MPDMGIAIAAGAVGVLIAFACVQVPRLFARRNKPYDDADAIAYEHQTGRSAQQIEQENAVVRPPQQAKPQEGTSSDG
jgi:cell division septation protein DedD